MPFFESAAGLISKLTVSVAGRALSEKIKDLRTERRMTRMVDDAVDRIVEQIDDYLRGENVSEYRKEVLIASLCANLEPLAKEPQRFFAGDLDGALIFKQCHPNGKLPEEIREEDLSQFYTVLFPQIAHFLAGSRIALAQWQAEGFREEFKRLTQIAEQIRAMNAKVADLPEAVIDAFSGRVGQEAETLLREFAQTLLNNLLLRLDLSPLRAERSLHGSLSEHFVVPAVRERLEQAELIEENRSLLEALASPSARRIVHGGAGVGKTTCSLWLQSRLLQENPSRLAVVLRLREVTDIEKHSLLNLLRERVGVHLRDTLTDQVLRIWHETGRLVVILDGFDEVTEDRRDAVEKWIKDLEIIARRTALLVTSRPLQSKHLERLGKPWQQWDLLPFNESRIVEFIQRWHRYLPDGELSEMERKVDAAVLARTFFNDPSLKPLADTPLMLGTLLFVHHRDKKLPNGRVDLYERYIAAMLGLRDSGLGIQARATKLSDKEKRRVLSHIALHFHLHGVNEVNDETMTRLADSALKKFKFDETVERLLPALSERTGLLQGPGAWSFMHKTIGEFLVAELICDGAIHLPDKRRLDRKELWAHRNEDAWTAVLFFWAGKTTPHELEEFIRELIDEEDEEATMLALSLLHDQGDRLTHETQRELALCLLQNPIPNYVGEEGTAHCVTSLVPAFAYNEDYKGPLISLRGLSKVNIMEGLQTLFVRGIILPEDIQSQREDVRIQLSVAVLFALRFDGIINLGIKDFLTHLPPRDVALYCFRNFCYASCLKAGATSQSFEDSLNKWVKAFPFGVLWIPLLILGIIFEHRRQGSENLKLLIGPIFWKWHEEAVDVEWLGASDHCIGWGMRTVDILKEARQSLSNDSANTWGINIQQHADLLAWCERMIEQRTKLKMSAEQK